MFNFKRCLSSLLTALILASIFSCASDDVNLKTETGETAAETMTETEPETVSDDLPEFNFDQATFTVAMFDNINTNNNVDVDSETGDIMNDAIYKRNLNLEERFKVVIEQNSVADNSFASYVRKSINSGDSAFNLANARCTDALSFWQDGLLIPVTDLPT